MIQHSVITNSTNPSSPRETSGSQSPSVCPRCNHPGTRAEQPIARNGRCHVYIYFQHYDKAKRGKRRRCYIGLADVGNGWGEKKKERKHGLPEASASLRAG